MRFFRRFWERLENRVFLIVLLTTVATSFSVFTVLYRQFYAALLEDVRSRTSIVNEYAQKVVPVESFSLLHGPPDKDAPVYAEVQETLNGIRQIANVRYLFTAKYDAHGQPIYVIDGLEPGAEDFRTIGDLIEPEIRPVLNRCLNGSTVASDDILNTDWGAIFITCWPIGDKGSKPAGAIVMEFDAQALSDRMTSIKVYSILISAGIGILFIFLSKLALNKVSEPFYKQLAYTDPLTGMPNRTAFEHDLEQRGLLRLEDYSACSIVVYDLDALKQVNDSLGHAAGDAYIRQMADTLRRSRLSSVATSYRIGGDEFASLVTGCAPEELERLLDEVHGATLRTRPDQTYFSFSYGAAGFDPAQDKTLRDVFRRADERMYAFKRKSGASRPA